MLLTYKLILNMSEQYVNIRYILDRIMQHPLLRDITLEQAVAYTIDFMRIVGVPNMFIEKTEVLEVHNYRALLPCDFYTMTQVRLANKEKQTFRYSTDSFHYSHLKDNNEYKFRDLTYKIQGGIIYTSVKDDNIEISYTAIATDSEGYPMLPDNSSFTRALELYIKKQRFTILFDLSKITQASLQNVQQEYAWAVGDCQTEFNRLSLDKAEAFYNSWRTLILRDEEHRTGFINNGTKEKIKIN